VTWHGISGEIYLNHENKNRLNGKVKYLIIRAIIRSVSEWPIHPCLSSIEKMLDRQGKISYPARGSRNESET
jgi:hypothetical protein